MTTNPSAAELWLRSEASENPRSVAARVNPNSIAAIAVRLESELPGATPVQRAAWLLNFEKLYPVNFKATYRGDLTTLTAAEMLAVANGDPDPRPTRWPKPPVRK